MRKRLILVEGIPGSGKSTFARFLAVQLERNGRRPVLYHETTADHPIIFLDAIAGDEAWMDAYRRNWTAFLSGETDPDAILVMESALLQFPLLSLLNRDLEREAIRLFIVEICSLLRAHDVDLVFFYPELASPAIDHMVRSRGGRDFLKRKYDQYKHENYYRNRGQTGAELHLAYLEEYANLARELADRAALRTVAIENSARDWPSYERLLLKRFGLALHPDPPVDEQRLRRYAGTFRNEEMGLDLEIVCRDGELYIFGNRRLRSRKEHVFYLDDISVEVVFREEDGAFKRVAVGEKDLFANRRDEGTLFERIPDRPRE